MHLRKQLEQTQGIPPVILGGMLLLAAIVPAQGRVMPDNYPSASSECEVVESNRSRHFKRADNQPRWFDVVCGQSRVWVGAALSYRASYNPKLNSILVVLRVPGNTRVLLVTFTGKEGRLRIANVTRELAQASGRRVNSSLGTLDVDLNDFELLGRVSIPRATLGTTGEANERGSADTDAEITFDLSQYAARAQASDRGP